jgi:SpoIID/LytB domain protein
MRIPALRALCAATTLVTALGMAAVAPAGAVAAPPLESYPVPADGVFQMQGSGWGHGRGMSQWGAFQAATEGRTHVEILGFYYPGTTLAARSAGPVRVLLAGDTGRDLIVRATPGLAATFTDRSGPIRLELPGTPAQCAKPATLWRARAVSTGIRLSAHCGRWRTVVAGATVVGGRIGFEVPGGVVGTQNGSIRRGYRGEVAATRLGSRSLMVVNTLPMEDYLRPVVNAEVSSSWPEQALLAQAIAARSFAAHEALGRAGKPFDVYDSVRSQAYPGAVAYNSTWRVVALREHARTDAAITATAGIHVVLPDGQPALTQFSSSNGGATAASPLPHMVVAADPWDAAATRNPRLAWSDTVTAAALAARHPGAGRILAIEVLAREGAGPWGGRISALRIVGERRSYTLASDSAIRSALGTNSSMVTFLPTPTPA